VRRASSSGGPGPPASSTKLRSSVGSGLGAGWLGVGAGRLSGDGAVELGAGRVGRAASPAALARKAPAAPQASSGLDATRRGGRAAAGRSRSGLGAGQQLRWLWPGSSGSSAGELGAGRGARVGKKMMNFFF
jgi:hypothetical protein